MRKLKIDLIALLQEGTGQTVYFRSLLNELKNSVDLKVILPSQNKIFSFINHFSNYFALQFLPFIIKKEIRKNSLVHIVNQELFFLLPSLENKAVITLHDLSLYYYYKVWKKKDIELLNNARKIICVSNSTKKELIREFPFERKAIVVYNGIKKDFVRSNTDIRKKYGIPRNSRIILFVGSDDKKKNFFLLLKVFSEIKEENLILIKIGSSWTLSGENERALFNEFIKENNLQNKVKFLDFVPRKDLIDFYFESEVYVCPSHYEGFGLTLLEAMSCACPVLCSNNTSLPEVAGKAALFFDSKNEKELKEKLNSILKNENLRKELIRKGFQNIKRFNWKKTAEETIQVYNTVTSDKD
jgi:glycosyltransferase involved in cell wall biosynthesis